MLADSGQRVRKVLITGPLLADPGGVANYYSNLLPVLRRFKKFDIDYLEIGSTRGAAGKFHPIVDQARVRNVLIDGQFDLVHVNPSLTLKSFLRDGFIVRQARRCGIPVVVFFRGWEEVTEQRIEKRWQWLFRMLYGDASLFIVLASDFANKLHQWGITAPVALATTAVPDEALAGFSMEKKLQYLQGVDEIRVLFLARIEPGKGVLETLEGVGRLVRAGLKVRLTIAGDGAAMKDVVKAIESNPDLKTCVNLAGYVRGEEKTKLLASHHVYCLPTAGEGMPNSLLEAMAFGMAIVTCGVGGIKDFFEEGVMGHLLERVSGADVADKLQMLVDQPSRIIEMAAYNHGYARENFLAGKVGGRLIEMYGKVLRVDD